jgi:mono/diheme cytochrome c family protein/YHS domain-containing protein/uncharacterized membrane protein
VAEGSVLVGVFGRLHPLAVHAPIGFLLALAVLEVVAARQKASLPRSTVSVFVWLAALSAVFAVASGLVLSGEDGYGTATVALHKRFGIGLAIGTVALAIVHGRSLTAYRVLLGALVVLLLPTGHLGGTIAHGENFLAGPGREPKEKEIPASPAASSPSDGISYARDIAPILASRCSACHGGTKKKGGLSLKDQKSILAGGRDGPVIVPGKKNESEIVRRLRLPENDDDHMPPPDKKQPTEAEIATIEKWIDAGAAFDAAGATAEPPKTGAAAPASAPGVQDASPAAIEALRAKLAHVEPLARDSKLLVVSFAAVAPDTGDAEVRELLSPLLPEIADLSLARSRIGDDTMRLAARMPNLSRLDVRETRVTDAGVAALKGHAQLAELVLAKTHLTDAAVDHLLDLPALKRVFLWDSGLDAKAIGRLRRERPELAVDAGAASDARPIETEGGVTLTKAAPAPGPAVNTVCPVSGKPVDPAFQIIFKGKVIGFCCPKCPDAFRADPAKFESKLP